MIFCNCIGKDIDINILSKVFLDTPINHEMVKLANELSQKYKVGIITKQY